MHSGLHQAILTAATAATPGDVVRVLCDALATPDVALVRIWLLDRSADHLRLRASAGHPLGGGSYRRVDGEFGRVDLGLGKIGHIAASRTALVVNGLRGDEYWLTNPGWIARQGIRSFTGLPMYAGQRLVGVLAQFARAPLTDDTLAALRFVADFAAVRVDALQHAHSTTIYTRDELRAIERASISAALLRSSGRVFGPQGAATLLGMKPTTLISRMKMLGVTSQP